MKSPKPARRSRRHGAPPAGPSEVPSRSGQPEVASAFHSGIAQSLITWRSNIRPADETFFTVDEVAEILKVCVRTIRRWIKGQKLAANDFEGLIRIAESDLEAFIARHRRDAAAVTCSPQQS